MGPEDPVLKVAAGLTLSPDHRQGPSLPPDSQDTDNVTEAKELTTAGVVKFCTGCKAFSCMLWSAMTRELVRAMKQDQEEESFIPLATKSHFLISGGVCQDCPS